MSPGAPLDDVLQRLHRRSIACALAGNAVVVQVRLRELHTELRVTAAGADLQLDLALGGPLSGAERRAATAWADRARPHLDTVTFEVDAHGRPVCRTVVPARDASSDSALERALAACVRRGAEALDLARSPERGEPSRGADQPWWGAPLDPRIRVAATSVGLVALQGGRTIGVLAVEPGLRGPVAHSLHLPDPAQAEAAREALATALAAIDGIAVAFPVGGDRPWASALRARGLAPAWAKRSWTRDLASLPAVEQPWQLLPAGDLTADPAREVIRRVLLGRASRDLPSEPEAVARVCSGPRPDPIDRLVLLEGELAGVFLGQLHQGAPDWAGLTLFGLVPELRGRGLGADLHRLALAALSRAGFRAYHDATDVLNAAMGAIFERNGCLPGEEIVHWTHHPPAPRSLP